MIQTFTTRPTTTAATPWCMKNVDAGLWEGSLRVTAGLIACPLAPAPGLTTCPQEGETMMTWARVEALPLPREEAEGEPDLHATCQWDLPTTAEGERAKPLTICWYSFVLYRHYLYLFKKKSWIFSSERFDWWSTLHTVCWWCVAAICVFAVMTSIPTAPTAVTRTTDGSKSPLWRSFSFSAVLAWARVCFSFLL